MPSAAEPRRKDRQGPKLGPLAIRTLIPSLYGAALLAGFFSPESAASPLTLAALAAFLGHFVWRIRCLVTGPQAPDVERVEVGLLAMLAVSTAVQLTSFGRPSFAYGVLVVALAGSVPLPGLLALPLATVFVPPSGPGWVPALLERLPNLLWLELLAVTCGAVLAVERRRSRRLQLALEKLRLDAEHLSARAVGCGSEKKGDLSRLDDVLYPYLQEVKENAGAHGAVLALKTPRGELYVREMVSDSHSIREEGVLSLDGTAFHWILKNKKELRIGRLSDPGRLGYYRGNVSVRSFLGVPLLEGDEVEGVLAVDSLREDAFSEAQVTMLRVASHQVSTILSQIRTLEQVKREARDFKSLHEFSKRLGGCASHGELLDLVLTTIQERVQPDFSASALLDGDGTLSIEALGSEQWAQLRGERFSPEEGLAGWVLTSRQYLHYGDIRGHSRRPLFAGSLKVPEFPSVLIHPLEAHGETLGVLCLGSSSRRAFDPSAVAFCDILAQQTAQAILQLQSLEQLRHLAATDGLTGLANRRILLDRLAEEVRRCRRYEHPLALLVLDVDHFKKINDRFGHPGGDEVLRAVAKSLRDFARDTDLVARHGGEEFALLLPSTDEPGAGAVAERIRVGIEGLKVPWEGKPIAVRVSIGVSVLEGEKDTADTLMARADQALYAAKETGRNRVITFSEIREYASWK
ncbi:MAG: diguanylate cyclase [Deltaproteobacteria bacterium]|nr:diguanylate cyclase [Deltaproteobacteria bacterium]